MFMWDQSYATGNADIDAQHKQLFSVTDELQNAMKTGQSKAILGQTLGKLIDYTVKHFAFEQALLASKGYAETASHRAIHDQFTARIKKLKADHDAGTLGVGVELMTTLQKWLAEHIKGTDMRYAKELGFRN
jgi:hemerythrin-like metal-binding protein